MIANANNYLLLKQMLVLLQTVRLNGEVTTLNHRVSVAGATATIKQILSNIEDDFTIPYVLVKNRPIALCLRTIQECIKQAQLVMEPESEFSEMIANTSTPEALERCIYEFPQMKTYYDEHTENVEQEHFWESSREVAGELIDTTSEALKTIQYWVEEPDGKPLCQLIILSNCIELVDRLFAFTNDYYGAEDVVSA